MTKQDIIEYVMNTPHNTNRAVLDSMLNQLTEGGGGGGQSWTTLTEESVTTESDGQGLYVGNLQFTFADTSPEVLHITFNGTEYECNRIAKSDAYVYGGYALELGPDFSTYPFFIYCTDAGTQLITESAGTYTIKIEALAESGNGGSSDFSTAQVTVTNIGTHSAIIKCPILINEQIKIDYLINNDGVSHNFTVILYKGGSCNEIVIEDSVTADLMPPSSMTGEITYDHRKLTYTITGDGAITVGGDSGDIE